MKRNVAIGTGLLALLVALGLTQNVLQRTAAAQAKGGVQAPRFEVDPMWPKPLPNHWIYGNVIGVGIDTKDHVYIIHRGAGSLEPKEIYATTNPPSSECCVPAPPVVEFDAEGNFVRAWGGPGQGFEWPESNHGITPDSKGNLFIGGNGGNDGHILKFTQDGRFVMQVGKKGVTRDSLAQDHFFQVAKTFFYAKANEVFVADGYGNKRVAVVDADSGKMKRFWGAYGKPPDDKAALAQGPYDSTAVYQQFRGPVHCADVSVDDIVYVCDRTSNRLQVFKPDGTFIREIYTQRDSRSDGSVWDIAFSRDPQQRFLYIADGRNQKIRIFDRQSLTELTTFGKGGHYPGEWYSLHSIATDSKGNLYTTETYQGRRLQRFMYKGLAPVHSRQQGVAWPTQ